MRELGKHKAGVGQGQACLPILIGAQQIDLVPADTGRFVWSSNKSDSFLRAIHRETGGRLTTITGDTTNNSFSSRIIIKAATGGHVTMAAVTHIVDRVQLTSDGAGSLNIPRAERSKTIISAAGGKIGPVFGNAAFLSNPDKIVKAVERRPEMSIRQDTAQARHSHQKHHGQNRYRDDDFDQSKCLGTPHRRSYACRAKSQHARAGAARVGGKCSEVAGTSAGAASDQDNLTGQTAR